MLFVVSGSTTVATCQSRNTTASVVVVISLCSSPGLESRHRQRLNLTKDDCESADQPILFCCCQARFKIVRTRAGTFEAAPICEKPTRSKYEENFVFCFRLGQLTVVVQESLKSDSRLTVKKFLDKECLVFQFNAGNFVIKSQIK